MEKVATAVPCGTEAQQFWGQADLNCISVKALTEFISLLIAKEPGFPILIYLEGIVCSDEEMQSSYEKCVQRAFSLTHSKEQVLILPKKKHSLLLVPASIHITIFASINDFVVGVSDAMGLAENISKNFPEVFQKQWRNSMEHIHTKKMNISNSQKRL